LDRNLLIVANGFRIVGSLLGIPSLPFCLWLTWGLIDIASVKPDKASLNSSDTTSIGRDGIIALVAGFAKGMGKAFEFATEATTFAMRILDVAAAALTLVGACLFLTGRGLIVHAAWARIVAGVGASGILLASFLTLTSLRRGGTFALIPMGLTIYVLWVLVRRFN
jgi:hypothetical protein